MLATASIRRTFRTAMTARSGQAIGLLVMLTLAVPAAAQALPTINSLSPTSATRSGYVEVLGGGFGASGQLLVDGLPSLTVTWTDTRVAGYVAETAREGTVPVQLVTPAGASSTVTLTVTARAQQGLVK
jgi:hypothetical protein